MTQFGFRVQEDQSSLTGKNKCDPNYKYIKGYRERERENTKMVEVKEGVKIER